MHKNQPLLVASTTRPDKLATAIIARFWSGAPYVYAQSVGAAAHSAVLWAIVIVERDTDWDLRMTVEPRDVSGDEERVSALLISIERVDA